MGENTIKKEKCADLKENKHKEKPKQVDASMQMWSVLQNIILSGKAKTVLPLVLKYETMPRIRLGRRIRTVRNACWLSLGGRAVGLGAWVGGGHS